MQNQLQKWLNVEVNALPGIIIYDYENCGINFAYFEKLL